MKKKFLNNKKKNCCNEIKGKSLFDMQEKIFWENNNNDNRNSPFVIYYYIYDTCSLYVQTLKRKFKCWIFPNYVQLRFRFLIMLRIMTNAENTSFNLQHFCAIVKDLFQNSFSIYRQRILAVERRNKAAGFLKWARPPSFSRSSHYQICGYHDEILNLASLVRLLGCVTWPVSIRVAKAKYSVPGGWTGSMLAAKANH